MSAVPLRSDEPPRASLDLTVAGIHLAFRAAPGLDLIPPAFEYPPFLTPCESARRIAVQVESDPPPAVPDDAGLLFDTDDGWQLFANGSQRWLRMPRRGADGGAGATLWQAGWSEPLNTARLWAATEQIRDAALHHVIQYPLDQILITQALVAERGLLLHGAGVVTGRGRLPGTRSGAIALAGVSGAGKSTITRLLSGQQGVAFLSDDRVVARPRGTGHVLYGTPWAGDARVAEPGHAPLTAIAFLRQAPAPGLKRLAAADALERLLPVATLPWFDAATIGEALASAGALVSQVPCFELAFTLDPVATRALLDGLAHGA